MWAVSKAEVIFRAVILFAAEDREVLGEIDAACHEKVAMGVAGMSF